MIKLVVAYKWTIAMRDVTNGRGGVENTTFEAKAKDSKKIREQGQGLTFREQTLSRPRTGMVKANLAVKKLKQKGAKFTPSCYHIANASSQAA